MITYPNKPTNTNHSALRNVHNSNSARKNSVSNKPPRDTKPAKLRVALESYDPQLDDRLNQYIEKNS